MGPLDGQENSGLLAVLREQELDFTSDTIVLFTRNIRVLNQNLSVLKMS